MKVLVCGGRNYINYAKVRAVLTDFNERHTIESIVTGGAAGADYLAEKWAYENGIVFYCRPAEWGKYGRAAGPIRNKEMLDLDRPDVVIAFPGGKGTQNMIELANRNKSVMVLKVEDDEL